MIDQVPPVKIEVPQYHYDSKKDVHYKDQDFADMKTFDSKEKAKEFQALHGGVLTKDISGQWKVIYIPKVKPKDKNEFKRNSQTN
jgi:hypothetical protein